MLCLFGFFHVIYSLFIFILKQIMRRVEEKLLNEQKQLEENKSGGVGSGTSVASKGSKSNESSKPNMASTTTEKVPEKTQ